MGEEIDEASYFTVDDDIMASDPIIHSEVNSDDQPDMHLNSDTEIEDSEKEMDIDSTIIDPPSIQEAISAMDTLTRFYYSDNFMEQVDFDHIQRAFHDKVMSLKHQMLITDYFGKK